MQKDVIENSPPWSIALPMFWGLMWRTVVWTLALIIPLVIIMFGLSFFIASVSATQEEAQQTATVIGMGMGWLAGAAATCTALRALVGIRFGGYRLMLVRDDAAANAANG